MDRSWRCARWTAAVVGMVAVASTMAPAAAQPVAGPEVVTTLLPLLDDVGPEPHGGATDVNDRGDAVGTSGVRPTLWRRGEAVALTPANPVNGGRADAINERGEVIFQELGQPLHRWYRGRATELDVGPEPHLWQLAGFNDRGQALVLRWVGAGAAFGIWERDGSFTPVTLPEGYSGEPVGLSEAGHVAGNLTPLGGGGPTRPFLWRDGELTVLADSGVARAVNRRGQVAGIATGSAPTSTRAVIWDGGEEIALVPEPGAASTAEDINDRGQVVGFWSRGPSDGGSYLWDNGEVVDLGEVGGHPVRPEQVNERGQVIGMFTEDGWTFRAFLWDDGRMADLGRGSVAADINDRGLVAGRVYVEGGERPALWRVRWRT